MTDPRLLLDVACESWQLWPLVSFFLTDDGFTMVAHLIAIDSLQTILDANPDVVVFDKSRTCVTPGV